MLCLCVCTQTVLRSLHLPKNNSLYVLTPDIAPTASTSKNRYFSYHCLTSVFFIMWSPLLSYWCLYTIKYYRQWHECSSNTRWCSMSAYKGDASRLASKYCVHRFIRKHLTCRCIFFSHIHCDILRRWKERLLPQSLCVTQIIIFSSFFVIFTMILLLAEGTSFYSDVVHMTSTLHVYYLFLS